MEHLLYTQRVGGSNPSRPTILRSAERSDASAKDALRSSLPTRAKEGRPPSYGWQAISLPIPESVRDPSDTHRISGTKLEGDGHEELEKTLESAFGLVVGQIVLVDTVFSFDSIITAVGLARHVPVMITAVIIAMIIMFFFSRNIADFINKRPTLKILALAFLLMVGFSLFFEGLEPVHHSHIDKGYIYFAMAFAFGVELLNTRYKKKTAPPKK